MPRFPRRSPLCNCVVCISFFQISAADPQQAFTAALVSIVVLDVNEPPAFPASLPTSLTVSKLAEAGYAIVRLNARDPEGTNVRKCKL